jgi:cobalt-zinc-cadmium efflux system membrane fusion protein
MSKKVMMVIGVIILGGILIYIMGFNKPIENTGKNKESGSEAEAPAKPKRFEEIANQSCEHNIPIIECPECRYEVGVVKTDSPLIGVEKVKKEIPLLTLEVVGEIEANPNKFIRVRSRTSGTVVRLLTDLGQAVKQGDDLLETDSSEFRELHLELLRLLAFLKLSEKNYERENRLFQKKLTTEKDFLEAQTEVEKLKIELDTMKRKLSLLGLTQKEISDLPNHTPESEPCYLTVRSPLAGTVIERGTSSGEVVETNAPLVTIADLSEVWLWVNLYEKDLSILQPAIRNGSVNAEVMVATYPDKVFRGKIDYLSDKMDEHTRTVKGRIILDNTDKLLKIGMFVHCKLLVSTGKPAMLIPQDAILKDDGETFVFRQVGAGLFFKQSVKIGQTFAGRIEIIEGLMENEMVVVQGGFLLKSDVLREKMGAGCAD